MTTQETLLMHNVTRCMSTLTGEWVREQRARTFTTTFTSVTESP